jgi:hypothetical protein
MPSEWPCSSVISFHSFSQLKRRYSFRLPCRMLVATVVDCSLSKAAFNSLYPFPPVSRRVNFSNS